MSIEVYKKIHLVRAAIKASNLKKTGRNEYSKYDYYTPEQVDALVFDNCTKNKLFNKFELRRDDNGLYGQVTVVDLESGEDVDFVAATEMPEITATNASQQMGGCMTYSERYMLMFIYDIKDNNLDFDSQKPYTPKKHTQAPIQPNVSGKTEKSTIWLKKDMPAYGKARAAILDGSKTLKDIRKVYGVSKALAEELTAPGPDGIDLPPEQDTGLPF